MRVAGAIGTGIPQPAAELADVVLLARLHDKIVEGIAKDLPRIDEMPAFAKFRLGGLCPDSRQSDSR